MTEDWRGEHLIRTPKRVPDEAPVDAAPVASPPARVPGRCAVPGCTTALRLSNTDGVCSPHMHSAFYCRCRSCTAKQAKTFPTEGATP